MKRKTVKQQWLAAMTLAIVIACVPVAVAAQELTVKEMKATNDISANISAIT